MVRWKKWLLISLLTIFAFLITSCNWFNQPPVAVISISPTSGVAPLTVSFDGASSYDPDGSINYYGWDFGDGNYSSGASVSHTYVDDGIYTATLTVTDDGNSTGRDSVTITVNNPPPVAGFTYSPSNPKVGDPVTFDASLSYDPASLANPQAVIYYSWDFDDGYTDTGLTVTHTYSSQGIYEVTLTITDDDGDIDTATRTVNVSRQGEEYYNLHFEWEYDGFAWQWDIRVSKSEYEYWDNKDTIRDEIDIIGENIQWMYSEFILNPNDDYFFEGLINGIEQSMQGDYYKTVEDALYFARKGIRYIPDPETGYVKYPIETLIEGGDCEDQAIFYASLIRELGYGSLMIRIDPKPQYIGQISAHMITGVPVDWSFIEDRSIQYTVWYIEHEGSYYVLADPGPGPFAYFGYDRLGEGDYSKYQLTRIWDVASEKWIKVELKRSSFSNG